MCRHFDFDLDKTLYFFTSGRYEFTNKGGDMFIEALARLNYYIKASRHSLTRLGQLSLASLRGRLIEYQLRLG